MGINLSELYMRQVTLNSLVSAPNITGFLTSLSCIGGGFAVVPTHVSVLQLTMSQDTFTLLLLKNIAYFQAWHCVSALMLVLYCVVLTAFAAVYVRWNDR